MAKETKKTLKIEQIASGSGSTKTQLGTLTGLGLGKVNRISELEDTPSVRGMINKVQHLVREVN